MAAAQLEIFNNKMFQESLELLVKSLVKKTLAEGLSSTSTEVENGLFPSVMKKKMPDAESATSDSSYFIEEFTTDVSFTALMEDPITGTTTRQQQDSIVNKVEMSGTTLSGYYRSFTDNPGTFVSTKKGAQDPGITKETDPFISTLIKTIKKVAPNLCYKPKHLRRKKFKVVPFEFASVWRNLPAIFSDVESPTNTNAEDSLPIIALER